MKKYLKKRVPQASAHSSPHELHDNPSAELQTIKPITIQYSMR